MPASQLSVHHTRHSICTKTIRNFPIEGVLDPVDLPTCCSIEAKVVVPLYTTLGYSCPNVTLVNSG